MSFKDKLILLFLLSFISCELEEEDMIRAFSCLNIVTRNVKKDEDSQTKFYSPYMLTCFIKITNEQMKKIFSGIEDDKEDLNSLEEDEIQQLLDVDSLQDIPEKELKKYSVKLEKTMKKFEKMDREIERKYKKSHKNENDDIEEQELSSFDDDSDDDFNYNDDDFDYDDDVYDDDDDDYSSLKKSKRQKGFFRIFFRGIKRFFNNSNIWFVFFFIIALYFLLLAMRKTFEIDKEEKAKKDDEKVENKEKNEKENDSKENKEKEKENEDKNIKKEKEKQKVKKD